MIDCFITMLILIAMWLDSSVGWSAALVSQRSWVRFPFKPEFFQVSSFQPPRLKHLHCDDLHTILSLSTVQIYEFHILMFTDCNVLFQKIIIQKFQFSFILYWLWILHPLGISIDHLWGGYGYFLEPHNKTWQLQLRLQ